MADYINREVVLSFALRKNYDRAHANQHFMNGVETVMEWVETLPSADVAPVKHGHWEQIERYWVYECSCCGCNVNMIDPEVFSFCPNCGAKMTEEKA